MVVSGLICVSLLEQPLEYGKYIYTQKVFATFYCPCVYLPEALDGSQLEEDVAACGSHDGPSLAQQVSNRAGEEQGLQTHCPGGNSEEGNSS